jgi:hypothetical protein
MRSVEPVPLSERLVLLIWRKPVGFDVTKL